MARLTDRSQIILLTSLGVATAAAASIIMLDRTVAERMFANNDGLLFRVAGVLTHLGESTWYLIAAAVVVIACIARERDRVARRAIFFFAAIATSGIAVNVLKVILGRSRPWLHLHRDVYAFRFFEIGYDFNSFPSGHATTAGTAAMALCLLAPRYRWLWIAIGVTLALTRVVLYAHFVSDVLVGLWFAGMWTLWLWRVFERRQWLIPQPPPLKTRIATRLRRLLKIAP
jgi:undecaprenyl-diphosphatase